MVVAACTLVRISNSAATAPAAVAAVSFALLFSLHLRRSASHAGTSLHELSFASGPTNPKSPNCSLTRSSRMLASVTVLRTMCCGVFIFQVTGYCLSRFEFEKIEHVFLEGRQFG